MDDKMCKPKRIVKAVIVHDGAGVKLNRLIAQPKLDHIDPFFLLDEFKSTNPNDYMRGFPTHPHRGIETITYMISGKVKHEDSKGNKGVISDGWYQWMTAGGGILHSEMPEECKGTLWGFQLWLSLPKKDKMTQPRYQHLNPEDIPSVEKNNMNVKIISGEYDGVKGPAENFVKSNYFDVEIGKDAVFEHKIDKKMNSLIYVRAGSVIITPSMESQKIEAGHIVEFDNNEIIEIKGGSETAAFLFLSAIPNNEPYARGGPFLMNTQEEIRQAWIDYQNGTLPM